MYPDQAAGKRVPNFEAYHADGQKLLADWAVWDAFKLTQLSADGYVISKRTNPASAWIRAGAGKRSAGLVFAGDVSGGLGVSVKNFWQSYPASLEIEKMRSGSAALRVWLWSPDAEAMDMRGSIADLTKKNRSEATPRIAIPQSEIPAYFAGRAAMSVLSCSVRAGTASTISSRAASRCRTPPSTVRARARCACSASR